MCLKIVFILGKGWLDAYGSCVCCGAGDGRCQAGSNGERVLRDRLRQTVFPVMKETQSFRRLLPVGQIIPQNETSLRSFGPGMKCFKHLAHFLSILSKEEISIQIEKT